MGDREGAGFRTDRCPRSWAADAVAAEVASIAWYAERGLGSVAVGGQWPAVLWDGVGIYMAQLALARDAAVSARRRRPRKPRVLVRDFPDDGEGGR